MQSIGELVGRLLLDDEMTAALGKAGDAISAFEKDWNAMGRGLTSSGAALTAAVTVPIAGIGLAAATSAIQFESAFAGVRKTVDATEPEFAALAAGFRQMGQEIPTTVNELLAVGEAAGQLGIKKEDILEFSRTMADLGETTNLTADEAATATAQIQNIFGAAGVDVDRFGATLVALGNAGASTEKDIISMGLRIAGAGNQVGLSQAEVLAFASALSSVGIEADAGGSAISRVFLTINDAVMSGGGALEEFARIAGMSADEYAKAFNEDASMATNAFIGGLARVKGEGENVNETLGNLELGEIRVRDALLRASGASKMLTEQLQLGKTAWEENSALTDEASKRYETTEAKLDILWNKVTDVAVTLGETMLPAIVGVVDGLDPLIGAVKWSVQLFAELPPGVQAGAAGFLAMAAAAGPLIWGVGQLITAVTTIGTTLVSVTGATTAWAAAGAVASGALSVMLPVVAAVGAAWAGWEIGTWISDLTGLGDVVADVAATVGEFIGLLPEGTAKQLEFSRAAADALPVVKEKTKAVQDMSGATEIQARIDAELAKQTRNAAAETKKHAEANEEAEKAAKKAADAYQKLKDQISGVEDMAKGRQLVQAITETGGAWMQTEDQARKYAEQLFGIVEKSNAMGTTVPPAMMNMAIALDGIATAAKDAAMGIDLIADSIEKVKLKAPALHSLGIDIAAMMDPLKAGIKGSGNVGGGQGGGFAASVGGDLKKNLGPTIMKAFTGGGDVGKSVGGLLGGSIGEWAGRAAGPALGNMFGKTIGGAVGTMFGPVGTMIGGFLGGKIGGLASKAFGKLFGGGNKEQKQVQQMRTEFIAAAGGMDVLSQKAAAAGVSLDRVMNAKKVEDFKAAVEQLNMGITDHAAQLDLARQAAEEFGIPAERMGQAFKQAEQDLDSEAMLSKINALVASGVDLATIIEFAGDDVGAFIHRAIEMGTTVPKELTAIAASMIEQGTLLDANGEKFTDLSQIPFAENLDDKFSKLIDKLTLFLDGLNNIPSQIDIDINARTNIMDPDYASGGATPMAEGGLVTGPTHILAGEAGPEAIIPLDRLAEMGRDDGTAAEVRALKATLSRLMMSLPSAMARSTRDAMRGASVGA